jgi:hypothetical protein
VLDEQTQAFVGGERVTDMVLGLAASCERIAALLRPRRADASATPNSSAAPSADEPLALAILGVLSLRRSLWAALALAAPAAATTATPAPASGTAPPPPSGLMR